MGDSKPKDDDKSGIQFFRIDRGGDIAPAFPDQGSENSAPPAPDPLAPLSEPLAPLSEPLAPVPDPLAPLSDTLAPLGAPEPSGSFGRIEPVFQSEPGSAPPLTAPSLDANPAVQQQLDRLQPQIDSISRLSDRETLSGDQVDTLRKYISLKEAEARDLKEQQRQYQAFLKKVSQQLDGVTRRHRDLLTELEMTKRREEKAREEIREIKSKAAEEVAVLRNDYEERLKRTGNVENEAQELERKREEWKERVREELKRIKLKERELENKYELLKRDTQALLDSKDRHVLELKKKNDALELEMETLEGRLRKSNVVLSAIDQKKKRLIETMKLAITLLEQLDAAPNQADDGDLSPKGE